MSLSMFALTNKVAIVTGAGRGIGKAIAFGLAEAGAKVVLCARTNAIAPGDIGTPLTAGDACGSLRHRTYHRR